jgi:ATP-dependent RNA helicase DDX51/DBP6
VATDEHGRGSSMVDVLICTPGRLMDHLAAAETGGYDFHLRDLQYLVVDEIDRLLTQGYQDWPAKILSHIFDAPEALEAFDLAADDTLKVNQQSVRRRFGRTAQLPLQKLLFSATLTNNPQKLQALALHNPLFFTESTSERKKFQIPVNLKQWVLNMPDTAQKPVILIHLLKQLQAQAGKKVDASGSVSTATNQTLIFTSSVESTHRLYRLLECYDDGRSFPAVAEFSSALTQNARSRILKKFQRGECKMSVCACATHSRERIDKG